jgi:putative transposase
MLRQVEEALRAKKVFQRERTDDWIRAIGIVLYHLGLSLRDASLVVTEAFISRSHEAVRGWYGRARELFQVERRARRAIAVDETKVKVQGRWVYVWAAIDVDTWEVLGAWASWERSSFEALQFLRAVQGYCDGLPTVYVDGGPWYRWPLERLGMPWEHRTHGPRNRIEQWNGILKQRVKRFYRRWPWNADLEQTNAWLGSYLSCYHLKMEALS